MKNKNEKAITLIALVITIIVIVLLAAISINLAIGNNGIVNKAQTAKQLKDVSEVKEALELEKAPVQLKSYGVNLDSYLEQLNNGQKDFVIDYIDKIDENNAVISINSKYKFKLIDNKNGDVEITYEGETAGLKLSSNKGTFTYPEGGTFTVTENASGGTLTVTSSNEEIAKATIEGNVVTIEPREMSGTVKIIVTSAATETYAENKVAYEATIQNGELEVTAKPYTGDYDNTSHGITVTCIPSNAKIEYSTDGTNYSETKPTYADVGEYTTYYKVSLQGYKTVSGSLTVTIGKQTNTNGNLNLSETSGTTTYGTNKTFTVNKNTSGGALSVTSSDTNVATVSISGNTVTMVPKTNAPGTATITVKSAATGNYEEQTTTYTLTVKGRIDVTATAYSGTYDGSAHSITVTCTPSDAKIEYSTDGTNYSETKPTYTNATGAVTIYYKVTKTNYTTVSGSKTVTVNKASVTIPTLSNASKLYNGAAQSPTVNNYNSSIITQTGTASATNAGTYTITWALKDTTNYKWSDGTTANKSATWTIGKTALKNVITAANYRDKVNYSVTVNGVVLNKWRILYNDGTNVIMIYNDYLPNSTGIAAGAGLVTSGNYGVKSSTSRADLINKLNDTSKWTKLIRTDLTGKATAKGAVDLDTWIKSWNAKGYQKLYTAKKTGMSDNIGWGYYVGTSENPTSTGQSVSSNAGYNDILYFPYKSLQSNCYGYWLASPSADGTSNVVGVSFNSNVGGRFYGTDHGVCPAVYLTSDVLTSGKDASGAWVIE